MIADAITAGIKRKLALSYLNDLTEWKSGDDARFSRMVDGRGSGSGSPDSWVRNLHSICANPVVVAAYPDFPAFVTERLVAIGAAND